MAIYYIDRKTGEKKIEAVAGEKFLKWVSETKSGNAILEALVKKKVFSFLYGKIQDLSFSKRKIPTFVKDYEIDIKEAEIDDITFYKNFNHFFTRKLKKNARKIALDKNLLISPADGRAYGYENIDIDNIVQIKDFTYSLKELIGNNDLAQEFQSGTCLIVRLNPSDYHRFHFPDDGLPEKSTNINGHYYSVNPISLSQIAKVYCQNKREITRFHSDNFEDILMIEVGATCVGSIVQTYEPIKFVSKGAEKGYFKFGGSTVIIFIKKNIVKIDNDIIENTKNGLETKVHMGEQIGKKIK